MINDHDSYLINFDSAPIIILWASNEIIAPDVDYMTIYSHAVALDVRR